LPKHNGFIDRHFASPNGEAKSGVAEPDRFVAVGFGGQTPHILVFLMLFNFIITAKTPTK
jgi:hypothetical protein